MKLSVLQQDLLPPLQSVSRSVGVHSTLPVLDNILFSTEDNRLKIAATNLEIGIIRYLPVEILEPGEITVPAKIFLELISGLKQAKIEIEAGTSSITVTSGKFKATLNGIPSTEFPVIPVSDGVGVKFDKETLLSCSQILYAAAVDEGRPILTGILTEASEGKIDFVATDGFRLAHRKVSLPKFKSQFKSLIPRRTFEEVIRVITEDPTGKEGEVIVSVSSNQNQAIFMVGQTIVSSRLIEGKFPAWEKIIPTQTVSRVVADKEELLKAIKLAAIFARNESNVVVLKISKDKFSLHSQAKELGSQENEIEAQVEGEDLEIAFSAKFLLDAISNCPTSQLMIEFSGPLSPSLIKPIGAEGLEYIVMPVKLN